MKLSSSQIYNPVGTIIVVTGAVPNGYLACDGSAVNIADYQKLYDVLTGGGNSFPYGANPSATTFLLPNLDERQMVGGTQGSLGKTDGADSYPAQQISLGTTSNITSNYTVSANFGVGVGNFGMSSDSNTSSHTMTNANVPSHTHQVVSHNIVTRTGNTRFNGALTRSQRNSINNLYISQQANRNDYRRRQNGNGNSLANNNVRYRGQSSGDGSRVPRQGNTLRHNEWNNRGNNIITWAQAARRVMGGGHSHASSNLMQGVNNTAGNLASSESSAGSVNIDVNGANFAIGSDVTVDYGPMQGKQVIVSYAIKY